VLLTGSGWVCDPLATGPFGGPSVGEAGGLDHVVAGAHLNPDIDGDGARDGAECAAGSDPTNSFSPLSNKISVPERCGGSTAWFGAPADGPGGARDEDRDGLYDEGCPGLDADSDLLPDGVEALYGGSTGNRDTDADSGAQPSLLDGGEAIYLGTSPANTDSDKDDCGDFVEALDIGGGILGEADPRVSATDAGVVYSAANYDKVVGQVAYNHFFDLNHDGRVSATDAGIIYSPGVYQKRCSDS
jgi:hypothetical protein